MPLYKYTQAEFIDGFFKRGTIRVGTLSDYRKQEAHGPAIGDKHEGYVFRHATADEAQTLRTDSPHPLARLMNEVFIKSKSPEKQITIQFEKGAGFVLEQKISDCFVFCTSKVFDRQAMSVFGCDACIEIQAPDQFFRRISHRIRKKAAYCDTHEVIYDTRRYPYESMFPSPLFLKDTGYAYQKEVRAVWRQFKEPIAPFLVDVPDLPRLCRIFDTNA